MRCTIRRSIVGLPANPPYRRRVEKGDGAEFGEKSGFSGRNLWYMRTFYREYKEQPILLGSLLS